MRAANKPNSRTKPPEQRRDELMSAAQRLFLEQGVAATTIEQITTGAKVAKGTFYLYFSSRDEVLAALGERFAQQLLAGIEAAVAEKAPQDWKGKLATWADAGVGGYIEAKRLHDIVFYGPRPRSPEGLVDNGVIDHLHGLLQAGIAAKAWAIDDPRFTAVFLFSGLHGIIDDAHLREKRVNRKQLAQKLERLCCRAVGLAPD